MDLNKHPLIGIKAFVVASSILTSFRERELDEMHEAFSGRINVWFCCKGHTY